MMYKYLWVGVPLVIMLYILYILIPHFLEKRRKRRARPPDPFLDWAEKEYNRINNIDD